MQREKQPHRYPEVYVNPRQSLEITLQCLPIYRNSCFIGQAIKEPRPKPTHHSLQDRLSLIPTANVLGQQRTESCLV